MTPPPRARGVGRLAPLHLAADERRHEFQVEPAMFPTELVPRDRRLMLARELLPKACREQPIANALLGGWRTFRQGDVGIERGQRRILRRPCEVVKSVQPMGPPADEHDLIEPGA
ncbi:MAG TPA: hypothetical protein VNI83_04865 [Vicinamibacterales bacterium]|nr:hypothetical protein [Vicinamibacterales bacterium]